MVEPVAPDDVSYVDALRCAVPAYIREAAETGIAPADLPAEFDGAVLFLDVAGFTARCERLATDSPDGLSRFSNALDRLFGDLVDDALLPFGGHVVQFGGDAVSCCFFGPDHAWRAASAALAAQALLDGPTGLALDDERLRMRIGIAAGEVMLHRYGETSRHALVLGGTAGREATRIEPLAPIGTVCVDATMRARLGERATLRAHDEVWQLMGLAEEAPRSAPSAWTPGVDTQRKIDLLEPFVPVAVARRLRSQPAGWRWLPEVRRTVVVFFDVWNTGTRAQDTALHEKLGPAAMRIVRAFGGVPAKINVTKLGHRVMLTFGLFDPQPNDAERAVACALALRDALKGVAMQSQSAMQMRAGLHVGEVYFGAIGGAARHDITTIGDTVNVAARATAATEPFTVAVTRDVLDEVGERYVTHDLGPMPMKGKAEAIPLSEVVRAKPVEGVHLAGAIGEAVFGREDARAALRTLAEEALEGRGGLVGIAGDPGCGKSFLLRELAGAWTQHGGYAASSRCSFAMRGKPLAPLTSLVRAPSKAEPQRLRARVRKLLQRQGELGDVDRLVDLLTETTDAPTSPVDVADSQSRERLLAIMTAFVIDRARIGTWLYVVEDIHEADDLSLELLTRLAPLLREHRTLVVCTYQPSARVAALRHAVAQEVELGAMDDDAIDAMVRHELSALEIHEPLAHFLRQRSLGNPGHLRELLRYLTAGGHIEFRGPQARAAAPGIPHLESIVPANAGRLALAALDQLSPLAKRVLRWASAVQGSFAAALMVDLFDGVLGEDEVRRALDELGRRHVLQDDDDQWSFRDAVTHAMVVKTFPPPERRDVNRKLATLLKAAGAPARTLALHFDRGGDAEAALEAYERAGRDALASAFETEAVSAFDRWMELAGGATDAERRAIDVLRVVACGRSQDFARTIALAEGLRDAPGLSQAQRAAVDFWWGVALCAAGESDRAEGLLTQVVESEAEPTLRSDACRSIARIHDEHYDREQALAWLDRAEELAPNDAYRKARALLVRANVIGNTGDLDACDPLYREVEETARAHHWTLLAHYAAFNRAYTSLAKDELEAAKAGFEAVAEEHGYHHADSRLAAMGLAALGQTLAWLNDPEARPVLEKAAALGERYADMHTRSVAELHLGWLDAQEGDEAGGLARCERALAWATAGRFMEPRVAALLRILEITSNSSQMEKFQATRAACEEVRKHLEDLPLFKARFLRLTT